MITGRIKIFLGGLAIGIAIPYNFWEVVKETSRNPERAEGILVATALIVTCYLVYSAVKSLKE